MRAVLQRVLYASVKIDSVENSRISRGLLIFLGVACDDNENDANILAAKIANLRIFDDKNGKMNLSLLDVKGEVLVVSQFTLLADTRRGRRPSYSLAAPPETAIPLYEKFIEELAKFAKVKTGIFGADMKVELLNDGPATIILDTVDFKR